MNHEIYFESDLEEEFPYALLLNQVITAALEAEGVKAPCEVDVLITDDEGIHQINLEQRKIDRPTDVLSFPMFNYTPGNPPVDDADADPATGLTRYDTTHCIGCHSCAMACPYGAPTFRPTGEGRPREKMEKCHGCLERIQAGLQPACVHSCPTGALTWRWAEDGESSALSQLYQSWTALRPADRKK